MVPSDPVGDFLFFSDHLTQGQLDRLRQVLEHDPALAEQLRQWERVREAVRSSMERFVPERSVLVLYALEAGGRGDLLTDGEKQRLEQARALLERGMRTHPGLAEVVRQIRDDCSVFEEVWAQHFHEPSTAAAKPRPDLKPLPRAHHRHAGTRWAWRVAATVGVVAFAAVLLLLQQRDASMLTVRTADDEVRIVELADGSTVRLLGGSALTYADPDRGTAFDRRVTLSGDAFFEVAAGREGFTVATRSALATVLGTSFGVRAADEMTEVYLVTGRLSIAPRDLPERLVVLEEGQMSRVAPRALPSTPVEVDLTEALEWTGLFVFRATRMDEIAQLLSRRYGVSVTVSGPLASERVNGVFSHDLPISEILETIAAALGVALDRTESGGYALAASV